MPDQDHPQRFPKEHRVQVLLTPQLRALLDARLEEIGITASEYGRQLFIRDLTDKEDGS